VPEGGLAEELRRRHDRAERLPDLAQELGIRAMPTFIFFKNGEEVKKIVGADKKKIREAVQELKV